MVESYPAEDAEERPDGSWRVVLAVSERAWLERLLLDLGPAVRVVEPAGLQTVGAEPPNDSDPLPQLTPPRRGCSPVEQAA